MKKKPIISEVMKTLSPATTLKELLDLFNKLIKYPSYYAQEGTGKSVKTKPTFKDYLVIGLNFEGDILISDALKEKLKSIVALQYKGKFYSLKQCNDERESYYSIEVRIFKPIKVK